MVIIASFLNKVSLWWDMAFQEIIRSVFGQTSGFHKLADSVGPLYAEGLRQFLVKSPGDVVRLINVYSLAAKWNLTHRQVVGVLLSAAKNGLIDFRFESCCPMCKMHNVTGQKSLQNVHQRGSCKNCRISYNNCLDSNMVVYFSVNPSVRSLSKLAVSKVDPSRSVPAMDVVNTPEFRLFFGGNVLAVGKTLAINNVTILFTDLADSTATYQRRGDIDAFNMVRDHFDVLFGLVRKHNGAVVKTIGDSVMAAFQRPEDAVSCSLEISDAFDEFNKLDGVNGDSFLKIGIHGGSCVAVTLNRVLDYFGTTVNMAARVQALAGKREIMISQNIAFDSNVQRLFKERQVLLKPRQATLKGIIGSQTVYELFYSPQVGQEV